MCPQARKPQPFPDKKSLQFLAEPHPASVGMPLMMGGLLPWTHFSFCCQATRHVTKSFLMWTLSGSPWASSTQSGPCWCRCGLCPHVHRRGIPSFACCLRGGVALCSKESIGLALGCQIEGHSAFSPVLAAKKSQEEGGVCRLWDSAS